MSDDATHHFTYRDPVDDHLCQGDLVAKTADVRAILEQVHPHYGKDDYSHLLVLTQTCDLARWPKCKARYVTLSAVRPLTLVVEREVARYQDTFAAQAGVCGKGAQSSIKRELEEFVERLLNNNEPEYFYLEPDHFYDLHEPSCAFLRLSIAVRASDHYETLLKARRLSLDKVFQAKLGWLVGNIYSRVGTPDWVPTQLPSRSQFFRKRDAILGAAVQWVDDERLEAARTANPGLTTRAELRQHISQTTVPRQKDRVVNAVVEAARSGGVVDGVVEAARSGSLVEEEVLKKLSNLLRNDPTLSTLLK